MSPQGKFKDAAKKRSMIRFDPMVEVAKFYESYPEMEGSAFFVEVSLDKKELNLVRGAKDYDQVKDRLKNNPLFHRAAAQFIEGLDRSPACVMTISEQNDYCVFFQATDDDATVYRDGKPFLSLEKLKYRTSIKTFIFDHEAGHLVCPHAQAPDHNFAECSADAYATLRYIQRFGVNHDFLNEQRSSRLMAFLCDPKENAGHFTSPVTEHILKDADKVDFSQFSPQETVTLASRYAEKYALSTRRLQALQEISFMQFDNAEDDLRHFSNTVLNSVNPDVVRWGNQAMMHIFSEGCWQGDAKKKLPDTKEWQDIARALKDRAAKLDEQGGLFFGLKSQKPAPKKACRP